MGNNEVWAQPNGLLPNGSTNVTRVLDMERWSKAEERTTELITSIQPNKPSEERRNAVASYVQRLITNCFSCQVFTFGSVPLKTYLPDGDIDVTAMSENESLKDTWANKVRDVLESEEKSENAEFHVKEVQYIQAEVKIIKCLVENIVVDISFNQVGGLCTLCFLEEIDHLINQNHLFKRSVILIKAWCYYESRILGAHHGLISTYALETLVLYIFHVFNNSFAGPLEVLYRFLEFFSNFDWDNFCVSLWGPVPIISLPNITAESPRQDSGELLLSKLFLHACSSVYAVFPGGQENQGQPFVSKHFNVIDPLRTSNNLGRSVSKGNFFRIRSAFSFGAKRMARLLDCPKENLIDEVNHFFMNTWERHRNGPRPDAPIPSVWPSKAVPTEEVNYSRSTSDIKKKSDNEPQAEPGFAFQGFSSQAQISRNVNRTSTSPITSHSQSQSNNSTRNKSTDNGNQFERNTSTSATVQGDKGHKKSSDFSVDDHEGQGKLQFSRTQSSPELTKTPQGTISRAVAAVRKQNTAARLDSSNKRIIMNSEVSVNLSTTTRSSVNNPSLRHSSSRQSLEAGVGSNSVSNSYHDDTGFVSMDDALDSLSAALEIHQEEQDLVNMMTSSRLHSSNGPVQIPMHLASPHGPLPLAPVLASMGYTQRNSAGIVPNNLSLIAPSSGSNVHFAKGFIPSALPHYFPTARSNPNHDEAVESVSENYGMEESNAGDSDHEIWQEHDSGSGRGIDSDNGRFHVLHSDAKLQSSSVTFNSARPSRVSSSGASVTRSQHKFTREDRGQVREEYADPSRFHIGSGNDSLPSGRNTSLRSSRSMSSSESSRDGSLGKVSNSARQKRGTKSDSSAVPTPLSGKEKSGGWHFEGASGNASVDEDDDDKEWVSLSTVSTNMAEGIAGSASLPFLQAKNHRLSGYELVQMSRPDSTVPMGPLLVGGSRSSVSDNSGAVPFAFYPTGPPVPFLTMLPMYEYPSDTGNSDGSKNRLDRDETVDPFGQNSNSTEKLDRSEPHMSSTSSTRSSAKPSEEQHRPDILNSDFASHWQNLQFGRFCQNTSNHPVMIYPSPFVVPPGYPQGHVSWDGPGRPVSSNLNFTQVAGGYGPPMVPATPLPNPGPSRPSGVFLRYGDEAPRYRSGTGTFLPNHKVSFRERQFSGTRNHRGNYNHDRSEHGDREGSWISSKGRASGRNHGRNQLERPTSRTDRYSTTENWVSDRSWDSSKCKPIGWHESQNSSFRPSGSSRSSADIAYRMYPMPTAGSNGVNPTGGGHPMRSVMMLYPYNHQEAEYGTPAIKPLEFGSLGPLHLSDTNEATQPGDAHPVMGFYEKRHGAYRGGTPLTSPDQPSSPQVQR